MKMHHNGYTRRNFMQTVLAGAVGLSCFSRDTGAKQTSQDCPNILFVYLDDLGYGDVSCYNPDSKIPTPNIDRLAKEGIVFSDAHTAAAICGPSRYGLMTGRYPWRRGPGGCGNGAKFRDVFIEEDRLTLASLLKKKGYNTAQIGKWGIRHNYADALKPGGKPGHKDAYDFPNKRLLGSQLFGFDYSWCMTHLFPREGATDIDIYNKHQLENGLPVDPTLGFSDPYRWLPDSAMQVVEYIETYAGKRRNPKFGLDRNNPFFIYWDPPSPHEPIVPNTKFLGQSGAGRYGDFVVEIDHYIGKMLDALDRLQLFDSTLVVFSSDNGPENTCYKRIQSHKHYSMGPLRGIKRDAWEGGHRVPLIVRWPGVVKSGQRCDELVCMTDWLSTFAEMTDQKLPIDAGEDSVSIEPLLEGIKKPVRASVVHHRSSGQFAIRHKDWLLVDCKAGGSREPDWFRKERGVIPHTLLTELFNLKTDPQQTINLSEKYPEKVKALKLLLKQELTKEGNKLCCKE